jgi:predicted PurR-regulated permease PerM
MFIPIIGSWIVYGVIRIFSILIGNTLQGVLIILFCFGIIELLQTFTSNPELSVQFSEVHPLVFLLDFIYGAITLGIPDLFIGPLILGIKCRL